MSVPRRNGSSIKFRELSSSISPDAPPTLPPDRHLTTAHAIWAKHPPPLNRPTTKPESIQKPAPAATTAWEARKTSGDRMKEFAQSYISEPDKSRLRRKTSHGELVAEDSGNWLLLDMPSQSSAARLDADEKNQGDGSHGDLPGAKHGALESDGPHRCKSTGRRLKSYLIGGEREPRLDHRDKPER